MIRSRRRPVSARPGALLALLAGLVALVVGGCSVPERLAEGELDHLTAEAFYDIPRPLAPGAPGDVVRYQRMIGAPDGAQAWRVVHHSRDVHGADIAVSSIVVSPTSAAPAAGRPVVAWAHPTTGVAQDCAPSLWVVPFALIEGLKDLLAAGYVVVATDYSGLGVAGPSGYLVGTTEANNLLDSVRAARALPEAHAGSQVVLWGHSQGGQAVLFAAQEAKTYAPELSVVAAAVAAPAVELAELLRDDVVDDSGVTLGSYAFQAYAQVYSDVPGVTLGSILTPAGAAAVPSMAALCLLTKNNALHAIAGPLVGHFLTADLSTTPPWDALLAANTPGAAPVAIPLLVNQGEADVLVRPATTAAYVASLCAKGEHVAYRTIPGIGHGEVALKSVPAVLSWFGAALAGHPEPATC